MDLEGKWYQVLWSGSNSPWGMGLVVGGTQRSESEPDIGHRRQTDSGTVGEWASSLESSQKPVSSLTLRCLSILGP